LCVDREGRTVLVNIYLDENVINNEIGELQEEYGLVEDEAEEVQELRTKS